MNIKVLKNKKNLLCSIDKYNGMDNLFKFHYW